MIISSLNSPLISYYEKAHPRLPRAIAALRKLIAVPLADGRYEIDGDEIFANVMSYTSAPESEKKFELHRKYIDIQYVIEGNEIVGSESIDKLTPVDGDGEDIEFFAMPDGYDEIRLHAGELAIILPPEPHAPGIATEAPIAVRKVVIKVLI